MTTSTLSPTAWQRTAASQHALHTLTDTIAADPASLTDAVRDALGEFDSLDDLLLSAHALWVRTFDARIDPLLESGAHGDDEAFTKVWSETVGLLRGTALLLEHHADHPAVVRAHAQHVRRAQSMLDVRLPDSWVASKPAQRRRSCTGRLRRVLLTRVRLA